jgi:enoyl-CoA hydratase
MVLFGEVLDAGAAVERGLAWQATAAESLIDRAVELAAAAASVPEDLSRDAKTTLAEVAAIGSHSTAVELELERQLASMERPEFVQRLAALKRSVSNKP